MHDWVRLRAALDDLARQDPCPLLAWATIEAPIKEAVRVRLQPWATEEARYLSERFGDYVDLIVGALRYNEDGPQYEDGRPRPDRSSDYQLLPSGLLSASFVEPIEIRTGFHVTGNLELVNQTTDEIALDTGGLLVAVIKDSVAGRTVGGYAGPRRLPRRLFTVPALGPCVVPVLVATASFVPDLGYAVPPREWYIELLITILNSGTFRMQEDLRITITP